MLKGIIFDLDGVLLSTDSFHYRAWKTLADRLDIPFDETANLRLRGVSRMESLLIILGEGADRYSQAEREALCDEKNAHYRRLLQTLAPEAVDPCVRETLARLRGAGLRLAVGSSSKNARLILDRTGLTSAFDAIVDGNDIARSKPDPEVFEKARLALALAKEECVVVEDAQAGIDAAKAAGMRAVAFGPYARDLLRADRHIREFPDLIGLLPAGRQKTSRIL